jgi:thiol-disulfide isomerase/thioredoxin
MRAVPCMLLLAVLCLTNTGCSVFGKKSGSGGSSGLFGKRDAPPPKYPANDPLLPGSAAPPPFPVAPQTPPAPNTAPPPQANSGGDVTLLAGSVVDSYDRPVGNTFIRWVSLEENKETGAPIDVSTDARGNFIIQGLKRGVQYQLIARSKQGDKLMAGITQTKAPNARVVILVKEDFVTTSTPPLPGSPGFQGENKSLAQEKTPKTNMAGNPGNKITPIPNDDGQPSLGNPLNVTSPSGQQPQFPPGIASQDSGPKLPLLTIPNKNKPTLPPLNDPSQSPMLPPLSPEGAKVDLPATRVPSCVLVGNQLRSLTLHDVQGTTWEFMRSRSKLTLLDFWGTSCQPCLKSMPNLQKIQNKFGSELEVVGIVLESNKSAGRVQSITSKVGTTYRQLIGIEGSFDVGRDFRIDRIPTLILFDAQGYVVWHHVGELDAGMASELDRIVRTNLTTPTKAASLGR